MTEPTIDRKLQRQIYQQSAAYEDYRMQHAGDWEALAKNPIKPPADGFMPLSSWIEAGNKPSPEDQAIIDANAEYLQT